MTMFDSYLKAQQLDRTMIKDSSDAGFLIATMASLTVAIVNLIVALLCYATCFLKLFYGKGLKIGGAFSIGTVEGFYSTRGNEF